MSNVAITSPDLTLLLDIEGVIQRATLSGALSAHEMSAWIGRPWFETVGDWAGGPAGDLVRRMVQDARRSGVAGFQQLTQRFPSGAELPLEFTAVRLGGKAGIIAIGRSLSAVQEMQTGLIAAQHAREQDSWKLREVETRYRLLFDASSEGVVLLCTETLRVQESNPAAARALSLAPGDDFVAVVAAADREAFRSMLHRVRQDGRAPGVMLHFGEAAAPWMLRASLMVTKAGDVFLLQLTTPQGLRPSELRADPLAMETLVEHIPDAFVVVDTDGAVRRANGAFLDLAQVGTEGAVIGQNLSRWVGTAGVDVSGMLQAIERHRVLRLLATTMRGELGGETEVELSAGAVVTTPRLIAVVIRDIGRRLSAAGEEKRLASALATVSVRLGETPLLQLVRDTSATLERHYIEAALQMTDGNRTAAAEMLGLSRQSLYIKLARYGLDGNQAPGDGRSP